MKSGSKLWAIGLVVFGLGLCATVFRPTTGTAQPPAGGIAAWPKYTVVETQGTNLLVVDNVSNTMFYYTVDQGKEVGDELKLRGSINLNLVGKPSINPTKAAK